MRLFKKYYWKYEVYNFFRRDLWKFFANIWRFRRELYSHAWWDYHFTLQMMYRSLSIMEKGMHNGLEIRETREKKIEKMQRVLELLKNRIDDNYLELAEKDLGIKYIYGEFDFKEVEDLDDNGQKLYEMVSQLTEIDNETNSKIMKRSREIEESQWIEIWEILKGQDHKEYYDNKIEKHWNDWFDGSGLRGWWD
jgi:hypothetical protein